MIEDVRAETKRAYDAAAEAYCEHVYACTACTMTGPHCDVGERLLAAENTTWNTYREWQP